MIVDYDYPMSDAYYFKLFMFFELMHTCICFKNFLTAQQFLMNFLGIGV